MKRFDDVTFYDVFMTSSLIFGYVEVENQNLFYLAEI